MKAFLEPEVDVVKIRDNDVICTSADEPNGCGGESDNPTGFQNIDLLNAPGNP